MIENVRFRKIKREIRIVGIDDGPFIPRTAGKADLIGVVFRGGYWLDGVMRAKVEVDGLDATDKIVDMIKDSIHYKQLRVIMLDGITYAGFNIVNIRRLFESTGLPVIALTKRKADLEDVKNALKNLANWEKRWRDIRDAGGVIELKKGNARIYMQTTGILREDAEKIVEISSTRSSIPEPLRVAHIVASGFSQTVN
jgi:endonuclease V-like protein UPF0215 family